MSITDELRDWIADLYTPNSSILKMNGERIADRIDAAHRAALEKLAAQLDETSDMRDFIGRIEQAAADSECVTLWGVDYTPLPLDADGVPIHIGDVMEVKFDTKRRPFTVSFVGERAVAFWVVGQPDLKSFNLDTVLVTHHHAPTVEDVLREFADEVQRCCDTSDTIAEFATKLRLAGEGE